MIELWTGIIGGGKSYKAMLEAIEYLCFSKHANRHVIANFPVSHPSPKVMTRWTWIERPEVDDLIALSIANGWVGKEDRCILIFDEARKQFNSRSGLHGLTFEERERWIDFFTQSRKWGYRIILISQQDRMIDRQIRDCAQYQYIHRNLRAIWFLSWLPFRLHAQTRKWYGEKLQGQTRLFLVTKRKYRFYDSYRIFNPRGLISQLREAFGDQPPESVTAFIKDLEERAVAGEHKGGPATALPAPLTSRG